jgi:hypothetical protein
VRGLICGGSALSSKVNTAGKAVPSEFSFRLFGRKELKRLRWLPMSQENSIIVDLNTFGSDPNVQHIGSSTFTEKILRKRIN